MFENSERMMVFGDKVEAAPELDDARFTFYDSAYAKQ